MRILVILLWMALVTTKLGAQPANDGCGSATVLNLPAVSPCPNTAPSVSNFTGTNVNATPTSPYPLFNCASGNNQGPAAEVWFTFVARANFTTITVNGLAAPSIVVFEGTNCVSLQGRDCTSGVGSATLTLNTLVGTTYYIMVSGGDINDQGSFNLSINSRNQCGSCAPPGAVSIATNPPPINGTYPSGQQVQVCVTVNTWLGNAAGTIEWLHAVTFSFGDGWDQGSIAPSPPASCDGAGSWGWYESWTGCESGQSFGPGFAYDSSLGLGCGGSPNDGDPGNNWGDGNRAACSTVTVNSPFVFCFDINVGDCPPSFTGDDIGISVEIWSDGDSGSWTQTGCNSGQELSITSSVVCCNDDDPIVTPFDASCATLSDGYIEMEGNGGADPSEVFNFYVFNAANVIVYQCLNCSGLVTTPPNLPAGSYSVTAQNIANDCARTVSPVDIFEPDQPQAEAVVDGMPCPGDFAILEGSVDLPGSVEIYTWTGPTGITYTGETVSVPRAGTYTLNVTVDGCPAAPTTVDVEFVDYNIDIDSEDDLYCEDEEFRLDATGDPSVGYEWINFTTGTPIDVGDFLLTSLLNSSTIWLIGEDANGCLDTASININILPPPNVTITSSGTGCSNETLTLTASGAGPGATYIWTDNNSSENPRILTNLTPGMRTFEVRGEDINGCEDLATITVNITPPPTVTLQLSSNNVCPGDMVTVTATASTPIGAINWNGAGPNNQNPITVTANAATTITANVTSAAGCVGTGTATITVQPAPVPPTITCGTSTASSVQFNWTPVAGASGYQVSINGAPPIAIAATTYTVNGLASNTNVTISVQAQGAGLCPVAATTFTCSTLSCPAVALDMAAVAPICLPSGTVALSFTTSNMSGTATWSGPGVTDAMTGVFDPIVAGVGSHTITLSYAIGACTYTDTEVIVVHATPTAAFSVSNGGPVCTNTPVTLTYTGTATAAATYTWDFGGGTANPGTGDGPHTVSWPTGGTKTIRLTVIENGCTSAVFTQSVNVTAPIATPVVSCGTATTSSVQFSWPPVTGATSYTVNVTNGPMGVLSGESYTVTGMNPGESVTLSVTANTGNVCGPTTSAPITCAASNCPNFVITTTPIPNICLNGSNAPVALQATVTGGAGNGTLTWSGTGVTGNQFNPIAAGAGTHTLTATYVESNCSSSTTLTVVVNNTPTSNFTVANANICTGQTTTITYTGTAGGTASYAWNFNGGTAVPGTGAGPHTVSWPTGGNRTITLTVTENGCPGASFTSDVAVVAPMPAPVINCSPNTTSIVFSWSDVPGAVDYQVNIMSAPAGAMGALDVINRTFTVTGLMANDAVEITVIAVGNGPCGNSMNTFTCEAQDCPTIAVAIDNVPPSCLTAGLPDITLTANVTGGTGTGTFTWAGPGIVDMATGTFSPIVAGAGSHTVTVTYREAGCTYTDDINIVIFEVPTAAFTVDSPICVAEVATVNYTGSAGVGAAYAWSFDGGTATPGTGAGPHQVTWATPGMKNITLSVTENGCTSETVTQPVDVNSTLVAPTTVCSVQSDSIVFTWPDVVGSSGYNVTVLDIPANAAPTGSHPPNTFTIAGLLPSQMATIQVEAVSNTACPSIVFQGTCALEDCPPVDIAITAVDSICLDASAMAIALQATATGAMTGTFTWSGVGIVDANAGTFDPQISGAGLFVITATYTEMNCTYTATTQIRVHSQPNAAFTVEGPLCADIPGAIVYTGGAGGTATYTWDFDGGNIVSGTGAGPYQVAWPVAGNPNVVLVVTENGCASDPFSASVAVEAELAPPVIICNSDNTSIIFSWNAVAGATGYSVTEVNVPVGAVVTPDIPNRTYTFTNLTPGDEVTIEVAVLTNSVCGSVSSTQTCTAQACPGRSFGTMGYGPFCVDAGVQVLLPVLGGGNTTGTFTWSGLGVLDAAAGTFDPAVAGAGSHPVTLAYVQDGCTYDTVYTLVVHPLPIAAFTVTSPICQTSTSDITFTGTAGASAVYTWNFDGGNIVSGTAAGPYTLDWATAGNKNITLSISENGCMSNTASETVVVEAPLAEVVVNCLSSSTSSITFGWADVPGASSYTVAVLQGPMGTLVGNTYTVDGLSDGDEVVIEVTAIGSTVCGNSTGTGTCQALACQPIDVVLSSPPTVCVGDNSSITFTYTGGAGGALTVDFTINGLPSQLQGVTSGQIISLPNVTAMTTIIITQVTDENNPNCVYPLAVTRTINVDAPVSAGADIILPPRCPADATVIDLNAALTGATPGGIWTETSAVSSTGGAFQAANGSFNAAGQGSATYSFAYTVDGGACPSASATVSQTIHPIPVANAGADQELTCNMGAVTLGGNSPGAATYRWTTDNPMTVIPNPTAAMIDVSAPGIYTLVVTNVEGCTASDQVTVNSNFDVPVGNVSISEVTCFNDNDGAIVINDVQGGTPPYTYQLNGGAPTSNPFFGGLGGAAYTLLITDANGCFTELSIMLIEPTEVAVTLTTSLPDNGRTIELGQSVTLTASYDPSIQVDTIIWRPDSIAVDDQRNSVNVSPDETTTYTVTVRDINGCSDSDQVTIIVRKSRNVYVPTAFSPDGDGNNDRLFPQGGSDVARIKSFLVFNRWGESVFEGLDIAPNDPSAGWDGRHRGQLLNAAVFVYSMEVEFTDGEVVLFKGDVMLMR